MPLTLNDGLVSSRTVRDAKRKSTPVPAASQRVDGSSSQRSSSSIQSPAASASKMPSNVARVVSDSSGVVDVRAQYPGPSARRPIKRWSTATPVGMAKRSFAEWPPSGSVCRKPSRSVPPAAPHPSPGVLNAASKLPDAA
jgi:hypothetical protein